MTPGVLIVAGPPGAGKTTIARLLSDRSPQPAVCLETDWFWTTITNGFIEPWLPGADHQNRTLLHSASAAAAALAVGGYDVVLEGVIGPWMLPAVTEPLAASGVEATYIVLRPDLDTCLARAKARADEAPRVEGHPPLTDSGPVRALWARFAALGAYEHHAVDTTAFDAATTVEHIAHRLDNDDLRLTHVHTNVERAT